ncbi:glutathione transferase [Lasiosphaeria ovina]|uniref:Glutathione transferase n=1 Tax=Lasiosphaeria ovina TaxID=92902 RepID=A0AAE0K6E1_9PEZI|nr:glutathione transferase [Lasiosphaeria ovina]
MAPVKPKPLTVVQHLAGSNQAWHGKVAPGTPFPPDSGRYRLYIGLFCPFAHRVNIVRHLLGLQADIPVTVVKPYPKGNDKGWPGWAFPSSETEYPGANPDPLFNSSYLHELYFRADPEYQGRYSVPVLWDTHTNTIVNNESAELMRDLPAAGFASASTAVDLYPAALRAQIDTITPWMQRDLNTGVYRAGFAQTQEDYDKAVPHVFAALNALERLRGASAAAGPYLLGATLTELDVRAYATVVRFDVVYVQHFKCNLGTIRHDYPQLRNWLAFLYERVPAFRDTTDFRHIKENYTKSHADINPRGITPMGPWPDVEVDGYDADATKVRVGGVKMPLVLELEKELDLGL